MLKCARGGDNRDDSQSDFRFYSSSSDGYESSSSCRDMGHNSKRRKKRFRGNENGITLQHSQGSHKKFCASKQRHAYLKTKINRKDLCTKHHAKRKKFKHQKPIICSCKAGDSCNGDLFQSVQEPAGLTRDDHNKRKRRSEYTEESTSRRSNPSNLNLKSRLEESSTLNLDLTLNGGWKTQKKEQVLIDKGTTTDGGIHSHTATQSSPSGIQSAGKSGCSLQKETNKFDLNVAIDEKNMLDASMMSAPQSCILEGSLANLHSSSSPEEFSKCKAKRSLFSTSLLRTEPLPDLGECCKDREMASLRETQDDDIKIKEKPQDMKPQCKNGQDKGLKVSPRLIEDSAKCKAKRSLFATNEEDLLQKEPLTDVEECCKDAEMASLRETQDDDIKIKENTQEMKLQCTDGHHQGLEVSPRLMEEFARYKAKLSLFANTEESLQTQDVGIKIKENPLEMKLQCKDGQYKGLEVSPRFIQEFSECKAKFRLFASNEESPSQKESLPDLEKSCEETGMASLHETQDEDIKIKEDPQEMKLQPKIGQCKGLEVSPRLIEEGSGRKARKKRAISKLSLLDIGAAENVPVVSTITDEQQAAFARLGSNESRVLSGSEEMVSKKVSIMIKRTFEQQPWDSEISCDLCHRGPSLSLGEWYSCCCGLCLQNCKCSLVSNHDDGQDSFSGKVHKMCGLWSIKTYNEDGTLEGLSNIVKHGKLLKCSRCQKIGATLVCGAKNCTQAFHYPCADILSSKLRCRMWIGPHFSVLCHEHRYDTQFREGTEMVFANLNNALKRVPQSLASNNASRCLSSEDQGFAEASELGNQSNQIEYKDTAIQISSDSDDMPKTKCKASIGHYENITSDHSYQQFGIPMKNGGKTRTLYYFGDNLLCEDISGGCEAMLIPCTNDVDSTPSPNVTYTTRSRYLARAKSIFNSLLLEIENFALPCKGCSGVDMDDPHGRVSCHHFLINEERHSDTRIDWQGQPMFGRLPYDQYGRLQVGGPETDIVECNSRCPCDFTCLNRELQKGLRLHLEVFRTETRQWAVRTTEAIPRGKFVVEFAGEILTHEEAHKRRGECNTSEVSCCSRQGHLDGPLEYLLVIDWYRMSNVACFIRQSCQGNLRMHRVYTEIKDPRFYRIGLYASRDIERGEELHFGSSTYLNCKHTNINFPFANARRSDRLINSSE